MENLGFILINFLKFLLIVAEMEVVAEGELGQDLHGVVIDVSVHIHLSFKIVF